MKNINGIDKAALFKLLVLPFVVSIYLSGCSGSSSSGGDDDAGNYTLSGTINGLKIDTVEIRNNQEAAVILSEDGDFSFTVVSGSNYNLNVTRNPVEQLCRIDNGSGSNIRKDVSNIVITCEAVAIAASCSGSTDSDGDSLTDCAEIDAWGTNPWLLDTDGDSYSDNDEAAIFNPQNSLFVKNPRIADMAKIAINLTSLPNVELVFESSSGTETTISTSHGQGSSSSISTDWGGETSRQIEIGHTVSIENTTTVGLEIEISKEPGVTFKIENALSLGYEESNSSANGSTVNWSTSEEQANSVTYDESFQESQTSGVSYTNGTLEITAKIENSGNIPYDIENLTLTAFFFDPRHPFDMEPIGTLEFGSGGFPRTSIVSNEESAALNFDVDVSLQKAQRLLRDSENIVIMPATYLLLDTNDNSILLRDEDVSERTAEITIDYGVNAARVNKYRVAINNGDGSKAVSLASALQNILGLNISQGPGEWIYGDDAFSSVTPNGLLAVGSYVMSTGNNQYWLMAHNHTTDGGADRTTDFYHLLNDGYDLNNIFLRARDKVSLVYVGDADRDGLSDRLENDYGTDQAKFDTDNDTLMDAQEIYGWMTNLLAPPCDSGDLVRVFSNPLLADSDGDGTSDPDEKAQCQNPSFDFVALAGIDQYINVDSPMTLHGDYKSTVPVTPVYNWLLLTGPDIYVNSVATRELSGREPGFTVPDDVSTLVFELEVSADGGVMTDVVSVQVQKDRTKVAYVGDISILAPDGSPPYASINEALLGATGDDVYVMTQSSDYAVQTVDIPEGISLFGGYNANWVRDTQNNKTRLAATVTQNNQPAVRINSASSEMWFSGFSITTDSSSSNANNDVIAFKVNGGTAGSPSGKVRISDSSFVASNVPAGTSTGPGSSYSLIANNLQFLELKANTFISGIAGYGKSGSSGASGARGADGADSITGGSGGPGGDGGAGGAGGTWAFPIHYNGYGGSTGIDSPTGEVGGAGGPGAVYRLFYCDPGKNGKTGTIGTKGALGSGGGAFNQLAISGFETANGTVGLDGHHGAGGGGGGGGTKCDFQTGGTGGGGGEGGQGARTGTGGAGGGASIGLWLDNIIDTNIRDNSIATSYGGNGGSYGPGGYGGSGGWGGDGTRGGTYGSYGGYAGSGGYGGRGGHGGAGSGGPSIGIYVTPGIAPVITGNTITSGKAGNGGYGSNAGDGGLSYAIYDANPGDGAVPDISGGNTLNPGSAGIRGTGNYGGLNGADGIADETNFQ